MPASAFQRPVAEYVAYGRAQLRLMADPLSRLERALSADDRGAAEAAWKAAYARCLHLGAVYLEGPVAELDRRIDGSPGRSAVHGRAPNRVRGRACGQAPSSVSLRRPVPTSRSRTRLARVSIDPDDQRTLRRSYNYSNGFDAAGQVDQGPVFVAFNESPRRQFVAVQKRLLSESMVDYITPIGGGYFFAPPGARGNADWVGSGLFLAS